MKKLSKEFWQNGFLVLDDFFDPGLMDQADRNIRAYFGENPDFRHDKEFLIKSRTEVIPWFPQNPELPDYSKSMAVPFDITEKDGRLKKLTAAILGEGWKPRKGTLVLLHGHTWHRVLPIRGEFRFSTNYRVCPAGTPADITDICVYRNMRYRFSTNSVVAERPV